MNLTFYQAADFFFIYSFLGWCSEVCFQAMRNGKLVNRGFLSGAWCPIYGAGATLVIWILAPVSDCTPLLFVTSVILCSVLEWLTGFILKTAFHQRWWDYSDEPFNIGGYVCLRFSVLWGLACVFVINIIHPTIVRLTDVFPHTLGVILLSVLGAAFTVDCAAAIKTMIGFNRELKQIDESAAKLKKMSDELTEILYENSTRAKDSAIELKEKAEVNAAELRERVETETVEWKTKIEGKTADLKTRFEEKTAELQTKAETSTSQWKARAEADTAELKSRMECEKARLEAKLSRSQRRLLKAFPKATSTRYYDAMEKMKEKLEEYKRK